VVRAVRGVGRALAAWGVPKGSLGEKEMIVFTLNSKCNVEDTLNRYRSYLKGLLDEFELNPDDIWADDATAQEQLAEHWSLLHPAGTDREGRQVMWLSGGGSGDIEVPDRHIRACCRYFYAVHADLLTLRKGVTLVIDTTEKTLGIARKLQAVWQKNLPLRPQNIYIIGTNPITRPLVNAFIAVASLFLKKKVISRIKHVDQRTLVNILGPASLPPQYGGTPRPPVDQWVRQRIADFPLMHLPEPAMGGPKPAPLSPKLPPLEPSKPPSNVMDL